MNKQSSRRRKRPCGATVSTIQRFNALSNFRVNLAYDGTAYAGWQVQPNGLTIQEVLEKALEKLSGQRVVAHGSGRTDAGVHAEGQVVSCQLPTDGRRWRPKILQKALNAILPHDIRVLRVASVPPKFHARFSAKRKTYRYQVYCGRVMNPFMRRYALHHPKPLDLAAMRRAAKLFVGKKNFAALSANPQRAVESTVRRVTRCSVQHDGMMILIRVTADGFLYKMARTIAGALIKVGQGEVTLDELRSYWRDGRRTSLIETAPAHGLILEKVTYGRVAANSRQAARERRPRL